MIRKRISLKIAQSDVGLQILNKIKKSKHAAPT